MHWRPSGDQGGLAAGRSPAPDGNVYNAKRQASDPELEQSTDTCWCKRNANRKKKERSCTTTASTGLPPRAGISTQKLATQHHNSPIRSPFLLSLWLSCCIAVPQFKYLAHRASLDAIIRGFICRR